MRIIGGKYKRRHLEVLSKGVSPTKDSLREALFNILMPKLENALVLELYAGSGAFAIEAISRGARAAYMVDIDTLSVCENIRILDKEDASRVKVVRQDALEYIMKAQKLGLKFDLIFLDPPYHKGLVKKSLQVLLDYDILQPDGLIIAEYERKALINLNIKEYIDTRQIQAGKTSLTFFKKQA
ncbi:MAG: 16S rRNA (guanine(966)-N(2))-methyltransferase RsmD [Candidatus Kappaea frigidicola]|nr:16S rRNA (guanine(966)-N(2))-methyltransferase RsmD [Candidatus Kappaea frigidicola]